MHDFALPAEALAAAALCILKKAGSESPHAPAVVANIWRREMRDVGVGLMESRLIRFSCRSGTTGRLYRRTGLYQRELRRRMADHREIEELLEAPA
jgi:hypothetical protein